MMNLQKYTLIVSLVLGGFTHVFADVTSVETPGNIGRLSYVSGPVSFSPAGINEWVSAYYNRPLVPGDRLWTDTNALAELQLGTASVRIGATTSLTIINLDNKIAQFQLAQGTFSLRVWSIQQDQVYEVDTPNLVFSVNQPGDYRIDVDADGNVTTVSVRIGQGEIYSVDGNYLIDTKSSCRFNGENSRNYQCTPLVTADNFDQWNFKRNNRMDNSSSARYVSREIIGYEDLDSYGSWRATEGYGNVWVPSNVASNWAPYRDGRWYWIDPWGWTWVDNQPWGFAPSHYGRWANIGGTWGWVPPRNNAALYSPALVEFINGGNGWSNNIAWFPIGPGEIYVPPYYTSRDYFNDINRNNTTINNAYLANAYGNQKLNINYMNRRISSAVTAVPSTVFVQSQEVNKATIPMSKNVIDKAQVTQFAAVAPVSASVVGAVKASNATPPDKVLSRHIVVKTTPPPPPVAFDKLQSKLAVNPGKPLTRQEMTSQKQLAPASVQQFKVVNPTQPAVTINYIKPENTAVEKQPPEMKTPSKASHPSTSKALPPQAPLQPEALSPRSVSPIQNEHPEAEVKAPSEVPPSSTAKAPPKAAPLQPEALSPRPVPPAQNEHQQPEIKVPEEVSHPVVPTTQAGQLPTNQQREVVPHQPESPSPKAGIEQEVRPSREVAHPPERIMPSVPPQQVQPESNPKKAIQGNGEGDENRN